MHGVPPVERRVRVLEHDLDRAKVVASCASDSRPASARDLELDGARRRADDPEQRARQRRLAAARLADEAERLARPDRRADADERVDVVPAAAGRPCRDRRTGASGAAARSTAGSVDVRRLLARQALGVRRGGSSEPRGRRRGSRPPAPRRGSGRRRACSGRRTRSPRSRAPRLGMNPGIVSSLPVILAHTAARNAAQEPDGVRMARILAEPSRRRPPRRAGRRRARRRGRTSSRSRRGCG